MYLLLHRLYSLLFALQSPHQQLILLQGHFQLAVLCLYEPVVFLNRRVLRSHRVYFGMLGEVRLLNAY